MTNNQLKSPTRSELYRETLKRIEHQNVIPLLTGKAAENIFHVVERISESGGCLIGVDFMAPGVKDRLKTQKTKGKRNIGVFSISTPKEARTAINSGAAFVFSPYMDKRILRRCKTENVFHTPGALTPTEVYVCYDLGADAISVFPSSMIGGVEWLKRLMDIFLEVKFIPTDKMNLDEAREYLEAGAYAIAPIIDTQELSKAKEFAEELLKAGHL